MKKIILTNENLPVVINHTINILKSGGLVVYPSDTVYGALVDANNYQAVNKLIEFKLRPAGKPISVFIRDLSMAKTLVQVNQSNYQLLKKILPGPFTVILKSKHHVCPLLEAENGSLGIRLPAYLPINRLLNEYRQPVTATSANLSGDRPHYSVYSLLNSLTRKKTALIDLVIDAGKLPRNKPSTVIDLTGGALKIIRRGDIQLDKEDQYISQTPAETIKISRYFIEKWINQQDSRPLVIIIEGELGVGKTVFIKGIAQRLGIKEVRSPSYVIYYEYPITGLLYNLLIHADFYNIQTKEELDELDFTRYIRPKTLICIEWGEKAGELIEQLKAQAKIIYIHIAYIDQHRRQIKIKY